MAIEKNMNASHFTAPVAIATAVVGMFRWPEPPFREWRLAGHIGILA